MKGERMSGCQAVESVARKLNKKIAGEAFASLSESGPFMAILDHDGGCTSSDPERFAGFFSDARKLRQICTSIDDGCDPVITQAGGAGVVATQLDAGRTRCGYLLVALPGYTYESMVANMDLIELLLDQMQVIAGLVEQNVMVGGYDAAQIGLADLNAAPALN